jgi:hypothetical protein
VEGVHEQRDQPLGAVAYGIAVDLEHIAELDEAWPSRP